MSRFKVSAVAAALILCVSMGTSAAASAPAVDEEARRDAEANRLATLDPEDRPAPTDAQAGTSSMRVAGPGWAVTCTGQVNDPHFSKGAGGAIYKTVITCTGYGKTRVNPKVRGVLRLGTARDQFDTENVKWTTRATSEQNQYVTVNGKGVTFYTPLTGKNGGRGTGFWDAWSNWYFVEDGIWANVGNDGSVIWKTI